MNEIPKNNFINNSLYPTKKNNNNKGILKKERAMIKYKVNVDNQEFNVTLKSNNSDKVKRQRAQLESIGRFLKKHPTLFLTIVSGYISISGLATLWMIFNKENINLFDYASISDFFFGFFAINLGPLTVLAAIVFITIATVSYYHQHWVMYWPIVVSYLVFAPITAPYFLYESYTQCPSKFDKYDVEYRMPGLTPEPNITLIASLSNYKIFKKGYTNYDTLSADCYIPKSTEKGRTSVIAINDGAIASMKFHPKF